MSTYARSEFEQIATAIGIAVKQIANLATQFEAAALWFRLDKRQPRRLAPSKRREKLNQVAKSARRLLKSLGINDPTEAADGCVYRKPKSAHNGDEARRESRVTRCPRHAGEDERRGRLCPATGGF